MNRRFPSAVVLACVLGAPIRAQDVPAVVALDPPHLASFVDPETRRLVVKFDRDMDTTAHAVCGGGPSFPKVLHSEWENARTFAIEVQLGEDRVYAMDLSCASSSGFRSKAGVRLPTVPWRIATSGTRLEAGAATRAVESLFTALALRYSYRDRLGIDWGELQHTHQEALVASKTGAALALGMAQLLQSAQDPHLSVQWKEATLPTWRRPVVANFDSRSLQKVFPKLVRIGRTGLHARTDDGIGYLFVGSFAREDREDFEAVLEATRSLLDCKAIVIDVRTNGGGDELMARRLAAFFVPGEKTYAAHRVCDPKATDGFQERQERKLRGNAPPDLFQGQVAVLMGPMNMSSCEAFLLMMKQSPQAILVGATSFGSSGNPQPHTLLPGLTVMLPSWQALRPDGTPIEGEGVAPHIHVETTPEQMAEKDKVLDEALLRLRGPR